MKIYRCDNCGWECYSLASKKTKDGFMIEVCPKCYEEELLFRMTFKWWKKNEKKKKN